MRKGGNTDILASAMMESAAARNADITWLNISEMKIAGCTGCLKCWSNGNACIQDDDMDTVYELLKTAEILVFCTPIYFYAFPAQLKALMDRMYPLFIKDGVRRHKITGCALLAQGGTNVMERFDGLIKTFEIFVTRHNFYNHGILCIGQLHNKGDARINGNYEKARHFADTIFKGV